MKRTGIIRKADELGRIVIPIELRDILGITIKDALEIYVDEESERVILKKYQGSSSCVFCGNYSDNLIYYKSFLVCRTCIQEIGTSSRAGEGEEEHFYEEVAATISAPEMDAKKGKGSRGDRSTAVMNQLHAAIMANPEASQAEMAKVLGISQGYVSILMKKLRESGLISK